MTTTYLAFDTRSGQILSVHHGAVNSTSAQEGAHYHAKISDEHIAVIPVPSDAVEVGKLYKVDVSRNVLVATEDNEVGVGFGFGASGRSS